MDKDTSEKRLKSPEDQEPLIGQARASEPKVDKVTPERLLYERRERQLLERKMAMKAYKHQGWKEGLKEGIQKTLLATRRSLEAENIPLPRILSITSLSLEDIFTLTGFREETDDCIED